MNTVESFIKSYPPILKQGKGNPEALKYGKLWEREEYRAVAPGEVFASVFLNRAKPSRGARIIDFGCGTGRGSVVLAGLGGLKVTMVDFVRNCLDPIVKEAVDKINPDFTFVKADLEKPIPVTAEYGFCTDVMEHIPPEKVDLVIDNILKAAQNVWFSIALFDDVCGGMIGEQLHLSVHPFEWWLDCLKARDCKIFWAKELQGHAHLYVSAWQDGKTIVDYGILNTEEKQIRENVKINVSQGWTQVSPHVTNDIECMILGGGPTMAQFEDEINKNRADGVRLLTLNGAYNWAVRHDMYPSAQIVVDARPFNARFVQPVVEGCRYLLASQCDPSMFEGLPKDRTFIWHTTTEIIRDVLDEQYEQWWAVPGGSTVLLRTIPLMRMLGYRKFILYGCDSCLIGEAHHAYEQIENNSELIVPVIVNPGGRVFRCHPWMAAQATEMIDLIKYLGDEVELDIKGDGLLSHIINVGAEQADLQKLS